MGRPTIRKDGTPLTGAEREARRRKRVGKSINRTRRKQRKDAKLANEDAERQGATTLAGVRLVQHGRLAAAVAFDPQEPRRKGPKRLVQRLVCGRQGLGAVGPPVALGWWACGSWPGVMPPTDYPVMPRPAAPLRAAVQAAAVPQTVLLPNGALRVVA